MKSVQIDQLADDLSRVRVVETTVPEPGTIVLLATGRSPITQASVVRFCVRRNPYSSMSYAFGPGGISFAVKWLIVANVAVFLVSAIFPIVTIALGLTPAAVFGEFWVWQPATYMFVHRELFHILFNMLALWMLGVELERRWGTPFFVRYYFVTGIGAALTTLLVSLPPVWLCRAGVLLGHDWRVGSGVWPVACLCVVLPRPADALLPDSHSHSGEVLRADSGSHRLPLVDGRGHERRGARRDLGGLVVGYLYLAMGRGGPLAEFKYRYLKWKMARTRKRFDVHQGGRGGWNGRVH